MNLTLINKGTQHKTTLQWKHMGVPASLWETLVSLMMLQAVAALKLLYLLQWEQSNITAVPLMGAEYCNELCIAVVAFKRLKLFSKLVPLCSFSCTEMDQAAFSRCLPFPERYRQHSQTWLKCHTLANIVYRSLAEYRLEKENYPSFALGRNSRV